MEEVWKTIHGFEDYMISNFGRVKSLKRGKEFILKLRNNKRGYLKVLLYKNGNTKDHKVHQLVAVAFLNHTPDGMKMVINHKDLIKTNNHVSNLEIVTQRNNSDHK